MSTRKASAASTFDDVGNRPGLLERVILGKPTTPARQFRMLTVLGAPGAGKTSLVDETIQRYRRGHPGCPVAVLDPNAQFGAPMGVWPEDGDAAAWLARFKEERAKRGKPPGLLVLDDADKYLTGAPPVGVFRDLFTSFRHWRLDVILNARRSQDVPKVCIASSSTLALFLHRELYGRQYIKANLGPEVADAMPTERFKYLHVDVDAGTHTMEQTQKRARAVGADR